MSPQIETLATELVALRAEIAELDALEAPTDEQVTRYDAALAEWDTKKAEHDVMVARAERVEAVRSASINEGSTERAFGTNVIIKKDPFEGLSDVRRADLGSQGMHDRAVAAFEDKKVTRGLSHSEQENLVERIDTVPGAAEYALAHGSDAYRSAYSKWTRAGGQNVQYTAAEQDALETAQVMRTALNITTGASGQFSLPTVFDPTLIHTGTAAINPIRQLARVVQGTQNVWNGVSVGNVTTYWHAEAAALTDGSPTLAHPIVTAGHLTAWVPASWEFFDDSSMVSQLPGLIGEAFGYAESTAFVTGTGTSQPLGVVTAISATAASTVTATTRGASSFTSASSKDVFAVANALPSRYENTASWIGNKATFNTIRQMSAAGYGSLFWGNMMNDITPNPAYPLLGYPTYNSSDVVSVQTTGTVILVLGDFSQYLILDVLGTTVEFVQNVVNSSGIPTGQRGIVARKRVGANVTDLNAFRFLLN